MSIYNIDEASVGLAWLKYCQLVKENGLLIIDGNERLFEIGPTFLKIKYVEEVDFVIEKYGNQELIELYKRKIYSKELIQDLNSTYGDMLFDNQGKDQVAWLIKTLQKNPLSKSASIGLLSPTFLEKKRRIPCLTTVTAKIRDNSLQLYATFRSQNIFNSYANFLALFDLAKYIARSLCLNVTDLSLFVISPHLYEQDFQIVKTIIDQEKKEYGRL